MRGGGRPGDRRRRGPQPGVRLAGRSDWTSPGAATRRQPADLCRTLVRGNHTAAPESALCWSTIRRGRCSPCPRTAAPTRWCWWSAHGIGPRATCTTRNAGRWPRCDPVGAAWIDHGRPVTPVEVHGGFDRGDGQTASREPSLESCAPECGGCRIHHPADTGISRSSSAFGLADHFRVATRKRTLKPKASGDLEIPDPGPPLGVTTTGSVLAVQGEPAERPRHQVRSCSSTRAAARTSAR